MSPKLRVMTMAAMAAVLAFALLAQARPAEEDGTQLDSFKQAAGDVLPAVLLSELPERWVGHTSAPPTKSSKVCGKYSHNGNTYKVKCSGFKFCRNKKCVSLLAMILPIIFGFLLVCLIVFLLCCFCGCLACCAICGGGDDDDKEVQMTEGPGSVQV